VSDEQIGPEDVAAAIRAHQAPSEVVDETGAPAAADDDSGTSGGESDAGSGPASDADPAPREENAP
jgi:hypothetical protein